MTCEWILYLRSVAIALADFIATLPSNSPLLPNFLCLVGDLDEHAAQLQYIHAAMAALEAVVAPEEKLTDEDIEKLLGP